MAIYHLHAKTWSKGAGQGAGGHARYVLRQGPYARRVIERVDGSAVRRVEEDRAAEVVASYSGHLPAWADGDPLAYWDAADAYERANGTVYRELEFALPMELSEERNLKLAQAFAEALARVDRGATPYTLVLHRSTRDPGLLHCHLMLSDRVNDGYERSPELWFRRAANRGKDPSRGGAPKTQSRISQDWLGTVVRPLWAELANAALEQARCGARIDHRSLEAQRLERELLAEQARERGDERAAARYRKAAAILDRPAQPKRGRVLEHGGPECAPGQARVWERYEKALVERQAAIDAVLSAEREAERLRAEIARERQREERRAAAKREREASHGGWPDGMAVARGVLAYLEALGRAYRQEVRTRWERRQAERRRVAIEAQRRVEQERQERRGQLLGLAASLAADAECRLRLREAYEAAGFRLEQRPDGKWVFVYLHGDLLEERQAVREARRAWDERRAALEAQRAAAREAEERRRREGERDRATEQEQGPGVRHPDKPRWQVERELILTEVYGSAVAEHMGRWYRIERRADALVLSNREASVTDFGDRVVAHEGNDKEIEALVLLAQAKGWERVTLTGPREFQERAAQAFVKAGIALEDQALEARAKEAIERQRREDIRERALLRQGYRRDAWEIRERWHWRQQERARRLEAERELARIEEEAEQARDAWRTVWRKTGHLVDADAQEPIPWGIWREQTLAERYGPDIAARAEAEYWYTRLRPDLGGLDISRNGQEVVDAGAALQVCSAGSMSLAVDLVRAKGWKRVAIGGPEDFRERAARALIEAGMVLADEALEQRAKAALDAERVQQERERALRRAMEGIKAHRIRWRRKDGTMGEQRALDYLEDRLFRGFTIQETAEGFRWWSADGKPGAVVGDAQLMALFRAAKAADQDLVRVVERIRMEVGMPNAAADRARGRTVTPKRGLGDDW
jgi:hypothetical protein